MIFSGAWAWVRGSDTDKLGDTVSEAAASPVPAPCQGPCQAASAPRADSAWFLSVDLPVWWADKETDHYSAVGKWWGGRS